MTEAVLASRAGAPPSEEERQAQNAMLVFTPSGQYWPGTVGTDLLVRVCFGIFVADEPDYDFHFPMADVNRDKLFTLFQPLMATGTARSFTSSR